MSDIVLSAEEIKRVKGLGCLRDKRYPDVFNVRVLTVNGKISAEKMNVIAEASRLFGSGEVAMTVRQTVEIQGVKYDDLDKLFAYLNENGLESGGTGPKVRPVVSCKGTTCQYGLIDTYSLSEKIHERFYKGYHDVLLPHKFKIAVGGCPNNCVKPELNDIGIIGVSSVSLDNVKSPCRGCKNCAVEKACPMGAAKLVNSEITIDLNICNKCGRCIGKCPFNTVINIEGKNRYEIYIGGRWGKKTNKAQSFVIAKSEEQVLEIIEKIILFFRDEGLPGERFADTIERLGIEYIKDKLLCDKDGNYIYYS